MTKEKTHAHSAATTSMLEQPLGLVQLAAGDQVAASFGDDAGPVE
jgi:hypothetical protein